MKSRINTLIELFDERAIENVLGPEIFRPAKVVYLCPAEVITNQQQLDALRTFYNRRQIPSEIEFVECSQYKSDRILAQLRKLFKKYPNMAIDVTGGTDAALFAAGMFCREADIPAFTYSRRNKRFYNIHMAEFVDGVDCSIHYSIEEFILMTGGRISKGRVDNSILARYMDSYDSFFRVYLHFRHEWTDFITFMQRISRPTSDDEEPVDINGLIEQKGEFGRKVYANRDLLHALQDIGFIKDLEFSDDSVSFRIKDHQVRSWLRDVGSVLELYMYKACLDAGIFSDVVCSAIIDWDMEGGKSRVSNEIDVVAASGVTPLFISCKTCDIKTEALNELAVLSERFGGKGAKAIIVTAEACSAAARHRAAQLGIAVIDIEELMSGNVIRRLKIIMKAISPEEST